MIAFMKSWCEGIIVAVMLSIIIELLIPEGSNKKYVKVVIGIYILFVILGPILEKINKGYSLEKFLELDTIEVSTEVNNDIKKVYIDGIEETIKNELIEKGYYVKTVTVDVDINYENIEKIEIELLSEKINKEDIQIDPIIISKNEDNKQNEYTDIIKTISENYNVSIDKIFIY